MRKFFFGIAALALVLVSVTPSQPNVVIGWQHVGRPTQRVVQDRSRGASLRPRWELNHGGRLHQLRGGADTTMDDTQADALNGDLAAALQAPDIDDEEDTRTKEDTMAINGGEDPVTAEGEEDKTEQHGAGDEPVEAEILQEGLAKFHGTKGGKVFYNRVMVVNRDLSVLMLRWFVGQHAREMEALRLRKLERMRNITLAVNGTGNASSHETALDMNSTTAGRAHQEDDSNASFTPVEGVKVLDAMSATGLRALRYALEVPEVGTITANDRDADAVEAIKGNVELCQISAGKIEAVKNDAVSLMLSRAGSGELFDMIDLDPFGTPSALLSSSIHALKPGGMLAVTATDLRVLCGNQPEVCFSRYGSISLRGPYSKEMAIRILLHSIRTAAAPLGRTVQPLVSVYMDFYVRVFVRIWPNRAGALRTCLQTGNVFHCRSCLTYHIQPFAVESHSGRIGVAHGPPAALRGPREWSRGGGGQGVRRRGRDDGGEDGGGSRKEDMGGVCCDVGPFLVGGPIWLGPLHDRSVVSQVRALLQNRYDRLIEAYPGGLS